jgi:hypothetical protein
MNVVMATLPTGKILVMCKIYGKYLLIQNSDGTLIRAASLFDCAASAQTFPPYPSRRILAILIRLTPSGKLAEVVNPEATQYDVASSLM